MDDAIETTARIFGAASGAALILLEEVRKPS
jgi:hypothetical protein